MASSTAHQGDSTPLQRERRVCDWAQREAMPASLGDGDRGRG
jgi:hypothetical protein